METDKNTELFVSLISSFQMQAMMHLGKLKNPVSEKIERDLDAAQMMIDMIDMIKEKTKGNISEDETKFIDQIIAMLKLNFVEEKNKPSETIESK